MICHAASLPHGPLNKSLADFKVVDTNGQSLAYVYGHADQRDAQIANGLTLDEARRIASNIAKLPVLPGKARPDDSLAAESNLSDERHDNEDTTPGRGAKLREYDDEND